jgi:transposase
MIGPIQQSETKLFHYGVNLEKRIRTNHPLRAVKRAVNFGFVRPKVSGFYGKEGHQSEDPIVLMKMMLLLFFDNVSSERELMRIIPERLDYLWFLDFDLDDEIPHHSVLSKARKLWGGAIFEELFVETVRQCVEAGLVEGSKLHMDGSLVEANASKKSVTHGPAGLVEQLRGVYRREAGKLDHPPEGELPEGGGKSVKRCSVSKTDVDAAMARKSATDPARPRYKNHRGIDDYCGVITAVETTPGSQMEPQKLMALVEQHERNTGCPVKTVIADAQYGTNENFAACQERKIRSHMKDYRATQTNDSAKRGIFQQTDFHYDAETETYLCPAGERLKPTGRIDRGFQVFVSDRKVCQQCWLRTQCTKSKRQVRTLKRHVAHDAIERARLESHSGFARQDRKRRHHLMERSFADAANRHGFKRARWRRLHNQRIQDLLIAACQNIRILIGSSRSPVAAAMGAVPNPLSADSRAPLGHWQHWQARRADLGKPSWLSCWLEVF